MGLDMYLFKNKDYNNEVAYWRKANQIRKWFADNLENFEDNGETPVKKEDLKKLVTTCKAVLRNKYRAAELLPPSSGFFFGSQQFDDWYWEDIRYTVETLTKVIKETDWEHDTITYLEWY